MKQSECTQHISNIIIDLEKSALEKWDNGNPDGFLELSTEDVVYFDPFTDKRIDGKKELSKLYDSIRGQVKVDSFEMINPHVQSSDTIAVLTYNLISYYDGGTEKWNCTEVYRLEDGRWKIIQTHWSFTKPGIQGEK